MSVNADPLLPLITISCNGADSQAGGALANGSVNVLQSYIQTVAAEEGIPASRRPVITSLGSALGLPSTSGPRRCTARSRSILLFGLSCYVILIATGGKEARAARAPGARVRAGACPHAPTGGVRGARRPIGHRRPAHPRGRGGRRLAPSLAHLRQFDAGAGLLTISDDLGRARAATNEASALEELHADAASRVDSTHGEVRSETTRSTHASPHRRGVRSAAGQTLFSRFSRS